MSLLRPERIHAILAPGQLVLARSANDCAVFPLLTDGGDGGDVLVQLERAVDEYGARKCRLQFMLAGDCVRYALTAPVDMLLSEQEEQALARQAFHGRYGETFKDWTVRHQPQELGQPFFACAVGSGLISGIQPMASNHEIRLGGIQPLLAVIYARLRRSRQVEDGWLAIVEPGWLHLILMQGRKWMQLASVRTFGHWADELNTLLMREARLHGQNPEAPLWLISAMPGVSVPSQFSTWRLLPGQPSGSDKPYVDLALGMA